MIIFVILALLKHSLHAQKSCHEFTEQFNCNTNSNDACRWIIGDCRCISDVKLDILFGIDTSDSIGKEAFQIEKQFISNLVTQDINNRTRIGFTMFSTDTNNSRTIDYWETYDLQNYISGLHYTGGWANTRQLISDALIIFSNTKQYDRQQILIMITNSNPPQSVCDIAASVKQQDIRVIIIGVADALNKPSVECLCQQSEDFIPVASFSDSDFESIMGSLSNVLCPISKECKITEVKAMKKPSIWNTEGDGRYTRFIEIYNTGIDFNANTLSLSGLVNMVRGPDVIIPQGTYVVFYDAADLPSPSIPSCHLCGSDCDLSNCAISGNTMTTSYCLCSNTIYIACDNSNDICPAINSIEDTSSASINAINGCNICTFDDSMTKTNWNVRLNDVSASGAIIDEVIYGNEGFWITTDDKYSYELISKGFDNSYGNNWAQSCNPLGTPGADPLVTCDTMCIDNNSCGGNNECLANGNCNCDINTGYYPQCIDATSCTKCLLVPTVNNCQILWTQNSTDTYAIFTWTDITFSGDIKYKISYYNNNTLSPMDYVKIHYTNGERYFKIFDYDLYNETVGGYVQTLITQCIQLPTGENCKEYISKATMCNILEPTPLPTPEPTHAPTWACPQYWFTGGTSQAICAPVIGAGVNEYQGGDRCTCHGTTREQCCLLDPDFSVTHDVNRAHKTDFGCKMDVELRRWRERPDENAAGISPGYLLTTQSQPHNFKVDIAPENYPCIMNIYWRLVFDCIDTEYENINCKPDDVLRKAGLEIDVTSGWLKVWGQKDTLNSTIKFTVSQIDLSENSQIDWENLVSIFGVLEIVNATSECQPHCEDLRLYPMRIPVWYYLGGGDPAPPSQHVTKSPWLWWLIGALIIFLAILIMTLYKWWKIKQNDESLKNMKENLDDVTKEGDTNLECSVNFNQSGDGVNNFGMNEPIITDNNGSKYVTNMEFHHQIGNVR